jgi:hypothetical protein
LLTAFLAVIQLRWHSAVLKKGNAHWHTVSKHVVGSVIEYLKYRGTEYIILFSLEIDLTSKVTIQNRRTSIKQEIHLDTLCQMTG